MEFTVRTLLLILSALALILTLGLIGISAGWDPILTFSAAAQWLAENRAEVGLLGLLGLGLTVLSLAMALRKTAESPTIIKETNLGTIRISVSAVETLIKRAATEIEGIREIHPILSTKGGNFDIRLAVGVLPDTNIPELANRVQTRVEEYLAQTVGITDVNVEVVVKEIAVSLQKARVK